MVRGVSKVNLKIARRVCLGVFLAFLLIANFDGLAFDVSAFALHVAGVGGFVAVMAIIWLERKQDEQASGSRAQDPQGSSSD